MKSRPSPPPLRASPSNTPQRTEAASSPSPASPPPRQSLVFGPHTTAAVSATRAVYVQEEGSAQPTTSAALGDFRSAHRRAEGASAAFPSKQPGSTAPPSAAPQRSTATTTATPASLASAGVKNSVRPVAASASASAATADELRELRQTRSLFLCGRGLLSLRHIQHLPEMALLRSLSVHMNSIKELERGCLRTLRHLIDLDLSANELRDIPSGCWEGLGQLERLNLSSNQLTKLGPTAFAALTSLQWLSLGFNSISDMGGLRSVPASAPLAYVDLCANRIATVEAVVEALAPHRAHVQELRLTTPSASSSTAAAAAAVASTTLAPPAQLDDDDAANATANTSSISDSISTFWLIEENPCCLTEGARGGPGDGGRAAPRQSAVPSPSRRISTDYVQRLLDFFPRLLVVNGQSYGVDPLRTLRQQRLQQELAEADTTTAAAAEAEDAANRGEQTDVVATSSRAAQPADVAVEEDAVAADSDDAFAELLRRPLPRLPSPSPSPSSSSTSSDAKSSRTSSASRVMRAASRRRPSRTQTRSRSRSRRGRDGEHQHRPQHQSSAAVVVSPPPARRSSSSRRSERVVAVHEGRVEDDAATSVSPSSVTSSSSHAPPSAPRSAADGPAGSAKPTTAHASAAAAVVLVRTPQSRRSSARPPRRASLRHRRRSSSGSASASSIVTALTTSPQSDVSTSPRAVEPPPQSASATPHARQLRFTAHSVEKRGASVRKAARAGTSPSLSLAGVTDTSDASPGAAAREDVEVVALAASRQHTDERAAESERERDLVQQTRTDANDDGARQPAREWTGVHPPPPLVHSTAGRMQWRPKLISRGTCTDGEWGEAAAPPPVVAAVSPREEELSAKVEQLQEQVALRTTTIADLRRHLDLTRTQYVEGHREAQHRQQQLRSQVAALKDELARRSEEAAILERKQQAQLNRSVESVKAEWARRLEAVEQHGAAALEEANAAWTERLARSEEAGVQLHQTLSVKSAQLATLERQTAVMESEMRALRARATAQLRDAAARTALLLAESEARRGTETAAATAFAHLAWSLSRAQEAVRAAEARSAAACQAHAEAALRAQQAAWAAQVAEYEEALRHAAAQVQQATTAVASVSAGTSLLVPTSPGAAAPASPEDAGDQTAVDAQRAAHEQDDAAQVSTPTAAALSAPDLPSGSSGAHGSAHHEHGHQDAAQVHSGDAAMALVPVADHELSDSVADYWRGACARAEQQLQRVEAALAVAAATQQSIAAENTRLLTRVAALESDAAAAQSTLKSASAAAAQEKENLLRTLHTLRADMARKDAALDALEEEAHAKLNDKRRRIAELEEAAVSMTAQQSRATEMSAATREQLEASQAAVQRLQAELASATERCTAMAQQQTVQLPDLERRNRELSELLATRNAEAHQHALEKSTLVHTLTVAREQLVRLHASHQQLERTNAGAAEQVVRLQADLEASRRQLHEVQEAMRVKQKATFETLSRMMVQDTL